MSVWCSVIQLTVSNKQHKYLKIPEYLRKYLNYLFYCHCFIVHILLDFVRSFVWIKLKICYMLYKQGKEAAEVYLSMMKINSIHRKLFSILQKVHLSFCRTHAPAPEHNNYHHYHQEHKNSIILISLIFLITAILIMPWEHLNEQRKKEIFKTLKDMSYISGLSRRHWFKHLKFSVSGYVFGL